MAAALFFFGTLRYPPLLGAVLGKTDHLRFEDAQLPDHAVHAVKDQPYPMIEPQPGACATGLVVIGASSADLARLDYYEEAFGYVFQNFVLKGGARARVYVPKSGCLPAGGSWELEDWVRDWGDLSVLAAREVMRLFGRKAATDVGMIFAEIRARAASSLRARSSRHGALTFNGRAEISKRDAVYADHFALDEFIVHHSHFDGSVSPPLPRAVFRSMDAALVLPYDPVRDRVLVVEQVRMGPLIRGDRTVWQLEPIAGHIDAGETPQEAARREALEEANLVVDHLEVVSESYASPGATTEFFYIYLAPVDLPDNVTGVAGLETEAENIRSHLLSFAQLMQLADSQQLANSPLLICAYWLARHRARLRREADIAQA